MKIERVEVFGVAVPLIGEYKNAYLSKTVQKSAIVRITAGGGICGLGNIDPTPGYSKEQTPEHLEVLRGKLAPLLIGMDATNVHAVLAKIEPAVNGFLDSKAAIEMACVDLAARMAGMPVVECGISGIAQDDEIELDLAGGRVAVPARGLAREVPPLPAEVRAILAAGGLIPFLKAHPDWKTA